MKPSFGLPTIRILPDHMEFISTACKTEKGKKGKGKEKCVIEIITLLLEIIFHTG